MLEPFSGSFGGGFISLGAGNENITFQSAALTGTTILGTGDKDTIHFLGGGNTAVFGSAIGSTAQVSFGASADLATFNGDISAASIYGGDGKDTMDFQNIEISGASIAGATGADRFSGAISVGAGGVSFFSGSGNDTFVFTSVTQVVLAELPTSGMSMALIRL